MSDKHFGSCFCGAVKIEASGNPEAMGYCHCESCRSWSAGPVNAFTLWKPENVKVTRGGEFVGRFKKTENSDRQFCTKCGGHLMTDHPGLGLTDVYAAILPTINGLPLGPDRRVDALSANAQVIARIQQRLTPGEPGPAPPPPGRSPTPYPAAARATRGLELLPSIVPSSASTPKRCPMASRSPCAPTA